MRASCDRRNFVNRILRTTFVAALAFSFCACAASGSVDTGLPRANEQPYPVILTASEERRERALAAWSSLLVKGAGSQTIPAPELSPVTATPSELPPGAEAAIRLPRVVLSEVEQSQEELRESLRRFLEAAGPLLGVDRQKLSLIEVVNNPNGTRTARYRQRPFAYPLRNGYGDVAVTFTTDLRVVGLASTAIPDTEEIRRAIAAAGQRITSRPGGQANRNAARPLAGQAPVTTAPGDPTSRQLVIFPILSAESPQTLRLHLAWEVPETARGDQSASYFDAVTGEPLGRGRSAQ